MQKASLSVVGTGIKFMSHMTVEAKAYIEQSDIVLYLVNEPLLRDWIIKTNPNSQSLGELYNKFSSRSDSYGAITEYILSCLSDGVNLCVVFYGHPCVFAQPALNAAKVAKSNGVDVNVLPGISAEDCLFADLLINPGDCGCQSFEATDFVLHRRKWDARSHLVLWQVGIIGLEKKAKSIDNSKGALILQKRLAEIYDSDHPVVLYEAALYPHMKPKCSTFTIKDLPNLVYSTRSTLYVSPLVTTIDSEAISLKEFDLECI